MNQKPTDCPCPLTQAANILGRKWTLVIVGHLIDGPKRFNELENEIPPLSGKVLSTNLKNLENNDIVTRQVQTTSPIKVQYQLTQKGHALETIINEVTEWAETWEN